MTNTVSGLQHGVIYGSQPYGLPLSEKIMPQWLKDLGYSTHIVGKVRPRSTANLCQKRLYHSGLKMVRPWVCHTYSE